MITRTEEEIQSAITLINQRRLEADMKLPANREVKAGYREAIRVLCDKDESLENIAANCNSVQARCIAWLAVDFLQGECSQKVLCNIPIKTHEEVQQESL